MDVSRQGFSSATQSEEEMDLRRGPWTVEEDLVLNNFIAIHGEGRWNSLAQSAGLKRTGKSCRLRWLNYLRPDVRRGNITLEEQLLILELHSRWGNRWSKIAQHLPGRTDNEIKNYWRTRVQKHAKQLQCDVNSKLFKDTMRYQWMPRLAERIRAAAPPSSGGPTNHYLNNNIPDVTCGQVLPPDDSNYHFGGAHVNSSFTPENSSTTGSSDSIGTTTTQVSPVSDLTDYYTTFQANNNDNIYNTQSTQINYQESLTSPVGYFNPGLEFHGVEQSNVGLGSDDIWPDLWNFDSNSSAMVFRF